MKLRIVIVIVCAAIALPGCARSTARLRSIDEAWITPVYPRAIRPNVPLLAVIEIGRTETLPPIAYLLDERWSSGEDTDHLRDIINITDFPRLRDFLWTGKTSVSAVLDEFNISSAIRTSNVLQVRCVISGCKSEELSDIAVLNRALNPVGVDDPVVEALRSHLLINNQFRAPTLSLITAVLRAQTVRYDIFLTPSGWQVLEQKRDVLTARLADWSIRRGFQRKSIMLSVDPSNYSFSVVISGPVIVAEKRAQLKLAEGPSKPLALRSAVFE